MASKGRPKGSNKETGYTASKMNKAEVEAFLVESTQLIFQKHLSYTEYISWCGERGMAPTQANNYWLRVWQMVKEKFQLEKNDLVTKHLLHYWEIHTRAMMEGDYSNARQVLDALGKLMGLNEPDKVESKTHLNIKFNFGDENKETEPTE